MTSPRSPRRPAGPARRLYSVVVFIVLASIDNVAIGLVPPLYSPISEALHVRESAVGLVTAGQFLVAAVSAVFWAYRGDRGNRKPLLMIGTVIWAVGMAGSVLPGTFPAFLLLQAVAAVGLGAVASVGFSVVSDLISPRRRGLVMSLWGLSQGAGTLLGTLVGGLLGADDWRRPFLSVSAVGVIATVAYLFTADIRRGESEPELAGLFDRDAEYGYRISYRDLPGILARRSNLWLTLQGLTAQVTFGSLVWLPRLLQAKAQSQGYPRDDAIVIGAVFATVLQLGAVLSIIGGLIGDRLQRRTPRGRALVAAVGILAGIPFYVLLFFAPLHVRVPSGPGTGGVAMGVLVSVVTVPQAALVFLSALVALALTSANSPNWLALIADVNPPEHRGTVFSLGNLVNGIGRAAGNGAVAVTFRALTTALPPPLNYATGLALFQVFFVPTGVMYWLASRHTPTDIAAVQAMLHDRAAPLPDQDGSVLPQPRPGAARDEPVQRAAT